MGEMLPYKLFKLFEDAHCMIWCTHRFCNQWAFVVVQLSQCCNKKFVSHAIDCMLQSEARWGWAIAWIITWESPSRMTFLKFLETTYWTTMKAVVAFPWLGLMLIVGHVLINIMKSLSDLHLDATVLPVFLVATKC